MEYLPCLPPEQSALATNGEKPGEGCFGANMQVSLVNDGPVTFWLES